jgi:phenylacetic acid degradation operon negative regulatory protein
MQVYDGLGPLAELRVRQIVATWSPEIAERAKHHTTGIALGRTAG